MTSSVLLVLAVKFSFLLKKLEFFMNKMLLTNKASFELTLEHVLFIIYLESAHVQGVLKLKHRAMSDDTRPIDPSCDCMVCK